MHTIEGRALGTPRYMAPERIREQGDIDGRSDLFSVGVVLYELLTGVCPFAAGSPAASLAAVLEVVVDPDPRIDPRVWLELRRALSKRPYERTPTATAMAQHLLAASGQTEATLTEVLRNAPLSQAPSEGGPGPAQRAQTVEGHSLGQAADVSIPRRRRALAWIATSLLACAALSIVGVSLHDRTIATPAAALPTQRLSASTVAVAPAVETASPRPPSVPSSASSTPAIAPPPPARAVRTPRPKPVATTPGF
jgi:serine/threonine protein kinase